MNSISVSQIGVYADCEFKHHLTYRRGLRKRQAKPDAMNKGSFIHTAIAAALRYSWIKDTTDQLTLEQVIDVVKDGMIAQNEEVQAQKALAESIGMVYSIDPGWLDMFEEGSDVAKRVIRELELGTKYTVATLQKIYDPKQKLISHDEIIMRLRFNPVDKTWSMIGKKHVPSSKNLEDFYEWYIANGWTVFEPQPFIEFKVNYPVSKGVVFTGIVDAVLFDLETENYVLMDWKSRKQFKTFDQETLSLQLPSYAYVLNKLGFEVNWTTVYQIKSTLPARNSTEFAAPLTYYRGQTALDVAWNEVKLYSKKIQTYKNPAKALNFNCRFCPFTDYCSLAMEGEDPEETIGIIYEVFNRDTENESED